ncbi:MAG: GPW/gp25 family protein [Clostridia bacterium]|nr:GPW/gp25 family protein [Clostridia bacterium]
MSYKVTAADLSAGLQLNATDTKTSVLQNIAIILATRKGTVPLHRDLGLSQEFVDKPIPVARVLLCAEVKEAIEQYEPRAEVVGVTFQEDPAAPGRLIPTVEVEIVNE